MQNNYSKTVEAFTTDFQNPNNLDKKEKKTRL